MNKCDKKFGLIVLDIQEKLFPKVQNPEGTLHSIEKMIRAFLEFSFPILLTEQTPQKLGPTMSSVKDILPKGHLIHQKSTFSALDNPEIFEEIQKVKVDTWLVLGVESHICVLQTAKDLKRNGFDVCVLNDGMSSQSLYDYSTAISECKDEQIRVSSLQTILYEILRSSEHPKFADILQIVKEEKVLTCCPCG